MVYSIGWFTTGKDKAARDLFMAVQTAIRRRELDAEIAFVFCNRDPGEDTETNLLIRVTNSFNIPFVSVSSAKSGTLPGGQAEYDRQIVTALESFKPDICLLADYTLAAGQALRGKYRVVENGAMTPGELIAELNRLVKKPNG